MPRKAESPSTARREPSLVSLVGQHRILSLLSCQWRPLLSRRQKIPFGNSGVLKRSDVLHLRPNLGILSEGLLQLLPGLMSNVPPTLPGFRDVGRQPCPSRGLFLHRTAPRKSSGINRATEKLKALPRHTESQPGGISSNLGPPVSHGSGGHCFR